MLNVTRFTLPGSLKTRHDTMEDQLAPELLTSNRHDHNDQIKNVPPIGEIVVSQSHQLHDTLSCEKGDKKDIDVMENLCFLLGLDICLYHHGDHV